MAYKPKYIKQSAMRAAAKAAGRRVSAEAIQEFDLFVGACIDQLAKADSTKKTIDVDALHRSNMACPATASTPA